MGNTKLNEFITKNKKVITIAASVALAVLFVGSILLAIFVGGEFNSTDEGVKVSGTIRFNTRAYSTAYLSGDKFAFDTQASSLNCMYIDPESNELVQEDEIAAEDYGFRVNGKGQIYDNPGDIIMNKDVEFISVVLKKYPSLRTDIPVKIYKSYSEEKLTAAFTYEAEDAEVYKNGVLLGEEAKMNFSTVGDANGANCSGGACLRNFQSNDMKVEFKIVCSEAAYVDLTVIVCRRPDTKTLSQYYNFTINGKEFEPISGTRIPSGTGYFTPFEITEQVVFQKGINVITFESGKSIEKVNPANLDAIKLLTDKPVLGGLDALIEY